MGNYSRFEKLEILQRFYISGQTKDRFQEENHMVHSTLSRWMTIFAKETDNPPQNTQAMSQNRPWNPTRNQPS